MESQKDRFIRQYMEIRDDRKDRGFDRQSIERRQRIMPQGQKDLGIYPEGNLGENPVEELPQFGSMTNLEIFTHEDLNDTQGINFIILNESVSNKDMSSIYMLAATPDLVFTNCSMGMVNSQNTTTFNLNNEEISVYPVTYNNCTFNFYFDLSHFNECIFNSCDFTPLQTAFVDILKSAGANKEQNREFFNLTFNNPTNIYNNCKILDYDELWADAPEPISPYGVQGNVEVFNTEEVFYTQSYQKPLIKINESYENQSFVNYVIVINSENLTINNSKIEQFLATRTALPLQEESPNVEIYSANFNYCTFYYLEGAYPNMQGSVFNNCDMTPLETSVINFFKNYPGATKEDVEYIFYNYIRPNEVEFNNCKHVDFETIYGS